MPDLLPGAQIAGCRIEAVAGRGGMGIVYRATQLSLGRPVAVKLIAPDRAGDPGFRERFERESRVAAAIDHPNVIPVYEAGEEGGHLYLVMRYVSGTDLQGLLARERRLPPARSRAIALQVGAALDAAHAAGLVHRDVKPANVLLGGRARLPGRLRPLAADRHRHAAHDHRAVDRHGRLHGARAASPARTSTRAPTSTRSAACSTRR